MTKKDKNFTQTKHLSLTSIRSDTALTIPEQIGKKRVSSIADSAFTTSWDTPPKQAQILEKLESVIIPDGILSIGSRAFASCKNLASVRLPDTLTSIGSGAFEACSNLSHINFPNSLSSIGSTAFFNCPGMADENGFVIIKDTLIQYLGSSESVVIPDSITRISSLAFSFRKSVKSITLPPEVTVIGSYAFSNCSNLAFINIPDGVTSIGKNAFEHCENLASLHIPDSVIDIGDGAFAGCSKLKDERGFFILRNMLLLYRAKKKRLSFLKALQALAWKLSAAVKTSQAFIFRTV